MIITGRRRTLCAAALVFFGLHGPLGKTAQEGDGTLATQSGEIEALEKPLRCRARIALRSARPGIGARFNPAPFAELPGVAECVRVTKSTYANWTAV